MASVGRLRSRASPLRRRSSAAHGQHRPCEPEFLRDGGGGDAWPAERGAPDRARDGPVGQRWLREFVSIGGGGVT
eukprot:scaffold2858_cov659-Pavlova_lutheri.AAC.168